MRRSAWILGGLLALVATPALSATSEALSEDALELGKWLARLGPGMLVVGVLVAFLAFALLRRTTSWPRRAIIAALTLALGPALIIGAPLLAWNLGKEAPVTGEVRAWNRLQQDVQITDGSGTKLEVQACGYASGRLDIHRMTVASGSRFLWTLGGRIGDVRYIVIDAAAVAEGVRFSETEPTQFADCASVPD